MIAIDGCSSACCTRVLVAKGVRPASVIGLHELGVEQGAEVDERELEAIFAEILARLEPLLGEEPPGAPLPVAGPDAVRRRRVPPPTPSPAPRTRPAHSIDDYLRAIYVLASPIAECGAVVQDAPTLAAHVSRVLGVSRAAAGEMLKRLERAGLVERGVGHEILLTRAGRAAAERAVRHHRVLERFLTDFVGYSPAESYEQAGLLRDAFDDEMIERIAQRLGAPERCPHGWPIDPALEREESRDLAALSALVSGQRGTIVRLAERDPTLLGWFYEQGLVPGAEVEVCAVEPAAQQLSVRLGSNVRAISGRAAADIFVRVGADSTRPRAAGSER